MLEIISQKIIPFQPEKNIPSLNTSKDKKTDKQSGGIQNLFDYVMAENICVSVTLTSEISGISVTSKTPVPVINKPGTSKFSDFKSISEAVNMPPKK